MNERELERILDEAFRSVIQTNFPQAGSVLTRIGEELSRNDSIGEQSTNTVNTNEDFQQDVSYSTVPITTINTPSNNENDTSQTTSNNNTNTTTTTTNTTTTSTNTTTRNNQNTTSTTTTTSIPFVQQPNTHILDITHNLFLNYHENMRLYQHNLSLMFRHLQSLSRNSSNMSSSTNTHSSRIRPRNRTSGLFSGLQDNLLEIQSFPFYGIFPSGNGETSHSIPTIQQFTDGTEMCTYTHETLGAISRTCPITLEEFHEHEQVHKIKHCGHFFKTIPLQNWFSRNSHCPVCRYDIRTYDPNEESEQQPRPIFARQEGRSNSL